MNSSILTRISLRATGVLTALAVLAIACAIQAQSSVAGRFLGSITAISGDTLTVKTDAGEQHQVQVPAKASLKRVAPGQKDLSTAVTIQFSELAVGDRILVKLDPNTAGTPPQAALIIAIKQQDLAQKQQADREDWQKRGIGGLVKSVDASAGTITVTTGAGPTSKTVTVHTTPSTVLKRYAQASVAYDKAQPAPIDAIHPGDQLRARGAKNADGSEIAAEEVVSGTFRNISGTVASIDPANSTFVVKDLTTKKTFTIHVTPEAQMRRLPERMAQMLAMRLKGGAGAGAAGASRAGGASQASIQPTDQPGTQGAPATPQRNWNGAAGGNGQWSGQGAGGASGGGDMTQMLSRAPAIKFADLQKGEAVMIVATDGTSDVTAITLVAGVEPLLEAPAASQNLLANWSVGGGAADAAAGTQ